MNSSLVNNTRLLAGLGSEFAALLDLCRDAEASAEEIGKALRPLVDEEYEKQYGSYASYWLLRAIAAELFQPLYARRSGRQCRENARRCSDIHSVEEAYVKLRIEVLEQRLQRTPASLGPKRRRLYENRLERAKESTLATHASS